MMNRRNRRYREKKPVSTTSLVYAGVSAFSFLLCICAIVISVGTDGASPRFVGGIAVLCMIATTYILICGIKLFKNENFSKVSRLVGVLVPAIATLFWILLYIVGIFVL